MADEKLARLKSTRVYGSLSVDNDTTFSGNVNVGGDLNVSGTINYVNTETILISDNVLVLNSDYTGSSPSENSSIEVNRGDLPRVAIRWNESLGYWEFTNDGTTYQELNSGVGATGYTGSQGYTGSASTVIGYTGSQGDLGYTGSQGDTGYTGSLGYTGSASTEPGYTGSLGYTGSQGEPGPQGDPGYTGSQGDLGYTGSQGDIGYTGSASTEIGYTGSQGDIGYTGSQGDQGEIGYTGSQGDQGEIGYTGSQGDQGEIGYTGSQGDLGYTGSQGEIGYTGSAGPSNEINATNDESTDASFFPVFVGYTGSLQTAKASESGLSFNPAKGRLRSSNLTISSGFSANSAKTEFLANSWSYSGTTITVTKINHGLSSGDYVYVSGATSTTNPPNGGPFEITVNDSNEFEFTVLFEPTGTAGGSTTVTSYEFLGVSSSEPAVVFEGKIRMVSDLDISPDSMITQNGVDVLTAQYIYEKSPSGAHIITTSVKGAFRIKTGDGNTYDAFIMEDSSGNTTFSVNGSGLLKASDVNVTGPYLSLNTGYTGSPASNLKGGIVFKRGSSDESGVYWKEDVERFTAYNSEGEKVIAQDGDVYDGGVWS